MYDIDVSWVPELINLGGKQIPNPNAGAGLNLPAAFEQQLGASSIVARARWTSSSSSRRRCRDPRLPRAPHRPQRCPPRRPLSSSLDAARPAPPSGRARRRSRRRGTPQQGGLRGALARYRAVLAENPDEILAWCETAVAWSTKELQKALDAAMHGVDYQSERIGEFYNMIGNIYAADEAAGRRHPGLRVRHLARPDGGTALQRRRKLRSGEA